jgi:hypothetical protein
MSVLLRKLFVLWLEMLTLREKLSTIVLLKYPSSLREEEKTLHVNENSEATSASVSRNYM